MKTYYVIVSIYDDPKSIGTMYSVYGYTTQLEAALYFKRNKIFHNVHVTEHCVNDDAEFLSYFIKEYGIPLGAYKNYKLEMRTNLNNTKAVPIYTEADDESSAESYVKNVYTEEFTDTMKKLPILLRYADNDNPHISHIWSALMLLRRYLQHYNEDVEGMFDKNSILINMIEEEGNYYYEDS